MENEKWKVIFGYDGAYQVSSLGRVRSHKSGEWKVMKGGKDLGGYSIVILCKDGKQNTFLVHRLVADAFIKNDDESKYQINHIDECKQNNRVSNLEYCTAQYNVTYNDIHHRRITKIDKIKPLYRPNLSIDENIELFRVNGIECSRDTVLRIRKDLGLTRKHKPYRPRKNRTEADINAQVQIN